MPALIEDQDIQVKLIPVKDIFMDHDFNTRETSITPLDVVDLAKSIQKHGLQNPIVVRSSGSLPNDPSDYKYVVVSGHRRLTAYKVNESEVIPAIVRDNLSEFDYRTLNVIENLKRKNLNMLEEARCIQHYVEAGYQRDDIAQEVGMSPGWVQVRTMVLNLPPEVQVEIGKGTFAGDQVRQLYSLKSAELQIEAARKMKEAKQKGERKSPDEVLKKPPKASAKKRRTPKEIRDIMSIYRQTFGRFDLTTRLLAWSIGEIDNAQLHLSIMEEAKKQGINYTPPEMSL